MRARSARRLSVFPARTQLSSVERASGVKVRTVGYLLIPNHDIDRFSLQLSTSTLLAKIFRPAPRDSPRIAIPTEPAAAGERRDLLFRGMRERCRSARFPSSHVMELGTFRLTGAIRAAHPGYPASGQPGLFLLRREVAGDV